MSIKAICPHCDSVYTLADAAAGKRVKCKKCAEAFTVNEDVPEAEIAEEQLKAGTASRLPPPARRGRDLDEDDYDDDRPRRRPQRLLRKEKSSGLPVLLIVGFGVLGVGLSVLIAIGVWSRSPAAAEQANNQSPPATAPVANAPPQNPPVQAAENQQAAPNIPVTDKPVVLFNGKISQDFPRPGLRFSVEYKFQKGAPAPGQHYFLIIEPEQGDGYEASINWTDLGKEDTLKVSTLMPAFRARGPYTMYLQTGLGLGRHGRETISNKLVVNMAAATQGAPGIGGPPMAGGGGRGAPPPAPPRVERMPLADAEITAVVADLESADPHRMRIACARLVNARPADRRDAVARALEKALGHSDLFVRQSVAQALAAWGTKESVPALIKAADDREFTVRWAVLEALVPLKDERAAAKLAEHLVDFSDRSHASKALQEIGSAAEKEVAKYVDHQDWGVRMEACNILKVIGTKNSLEALRKAQQDDNGLVKMAADAAAQACARR